MATIGLVQKQDDGSFTGTLNTLALKAKIRIVPISRKAGDNGPDYRVVTSDGVDIGGGWTRVGRESQREYVSLKLDVLAWKGGSGGRGRARRGRRRWGRGSATGFACGPARRAAGPEAQGASPPALARRPLRVRPRT